MKKVLLILMALVISGCAGYGSGSYDSKGSIPQGARVGIVATDYVEEAIAKGIVEAGKEEGLNLELFTIDKGYSPNPEGYDYFVMVSGAYVRCSSGSTGVAGAILTGLTAIAPVSITGGGTSTAYATLMTYNAKTGRIIGEGTIQKQGHTLMVNCSKQLKAIGEKWIGEHY